MEGLYRLDKNDQPIDGVDEQYEVSKKVKPYFSYLW